ncbi:anoctamin-like protein At1g73020 [Beta vulgaris subsp. vulgaris]|uniref:anoctamin-like protein At1g73020 n=1 Tax=Beta vulgaris subsp. vulgaris TaxID=3555 RepID=UPI002036FCAE|nr:anoctamin-like protein At1g73020 [Beta vulgaris subsp. vulgaris]
MNELSEEKQPVFEIALVFSKKEEKDEEYEDYNEVMEVLVDQLKKTGLLVETVPGLAHEFIKLAAPLEALGKAAAELQIRKRTNIGMDLAFDWDQVKAFARQADGSLFSWCERHHCYHHLIHGIVNRSKLAVPLKYGSKKFYWELWEPLLQRLETEGILKEVFPLHDEQKKKEMVSSWAFNIWDVTRQPIDDIYLYFGTKIAIYFAFLGMYTQWLLFPAVLGIVLHSVDFGSLQFLAHPVFFISIISWAVFFFQFWKRKNYALITRWNISYTVGTGPGHKILGMDLNSRQHPLEFAKKLEADNAIEKEAYQRYEWKGRLKRIRNDAVIILSIICLQLPFELAYAHLYEIIGSDIIKFGLTAVYLLIIQYFTRIGGKISADLIKNENIDDKEYRADSLIYKLFGLYFMQTYIGVFYHALLHRNIMTLRKVLIQRLIVSEVFENLLENSLPYLKYSYKKHGAVRFKKKHDKGSSKGKVKVNSRVEKEYLKSAYSASIGGELEDGLFDDFLELALQFGMIMMFASAFPLTFAFAVVNNIMEIRTDALKLLVMHKRPVPRAAVTIGAWLNIFQFLIVMSICTNCALLVCLYDAEGKWKLEPGLAAILIIEHILLLIKFGFSRFVPEEPAWVRARRVKNATHTQDVSRQLLRTISGGEKMFNPAEAIKES